LEHLGVVFRGQGASTGWVRVDRLLREHGIQQFSPSFMPPLFFRVSSIFPSDGIPVTHRDVVTILFFFRNRLNPFAVCVTF